MLPPVMLLLARASARSWPRARLLRPIGYAGLALLVACAGEEPRLPPVEAGARSAVVAVVSAGVLQAWATEVDGSWAVRTPAPLEGPLYVAYYRDALDTLGLTAGALDSPSSVEGPCARLAPLSTWRADPGAGSFVATTLPPPLAEHLLPGGEARCGRCELYREARATVPERTHHLSAGLLTEGEELLVTHGQGGLMSAAPAGLERVPGCPDSTGYYTLVHLGGDRYAAGTARGHVHELRIRGSGCEVVADRATTATISLAWLAAAPDGHELLAVDLRGGVHIGGASGPLERVTTVRLPSDLEPSIQARRGAAAWVSPGLFVVSAGAPELVWLRERAVWRVDRLPEADAPNQLTALARAGSDMLVGDGRGRVFRARSDDGSLTLFASQAAAGGAIGSLVPHKDGWIMSSAWGFVSGWYPDEGWCAPHAVVGADQRGEHVLRTRAGVVVVVDMVGDTSRPGQVVWLTPVRDAL